ncbi:MAG: cytidine deaminase [Bacteroidaceae bacterium]|nr:cytidine deaminase [Bacteroidaceae bacterium]
MDKYVIKSEICVYQDNELSTEDRELVEAAKQATQQSYSPYSKFQVGAALRLTDGSIVTGSNQENASYPLGLCAERTAIFHAQHQRPDLPVAAIAIAAFANGHFYPEPISPCGACRQVMLEVEDRYSRPMRVLLYGTSGTHVVSTVKALLPFQFVSESLKK